MRPVEDAPGTGADDDGSECHGRQSGEPEVSGRGTTVRRGVVDGRGWWGGRGGEGHWVAVDHLEGSFPGGVADLAYRFVMDGDLIAELVIAPR